MDTVITGGSIWAAGAMGGTIGTAVGTVVPGAGNVVGAVAGFVIGIGIYAVTDMIDFDGKTAREHTKDWVSGLWKN